jgi:hypothetical protein
MYCNGDGSSCGSGCSDDAVNCPEWEDNPGAYEFTATISGAIVLYDGLQLGNEGDKLAAFDTEGNVRGVGVQLIPPFGPYQGTSVYEVQLRSNNIGDLLTFQYYDAVLDTVYDIEETYEFATNDVIGDVIDPLELNIIISVDLTLDLIAGWNWLSINVSPDNPSISSVLETLGDNALFVTSQSFGTATNYGSDYGWYGSLDMIEPSQMYKLQLSEPAELVVTGVPVDVVETPINLIAGWNWLGYLPQGSTDLSNALSSVVDVATFISSQADGTAQNYGEYGWFGQLEYLNPGKGYLLNTSSDGVLTYPEVSAEGLTRTMQNSNKEIVLSESISDWDFKYGDYEFLGTITASVENENDSDGDILGVFVDGECRGLAERMYFEHDNRYLYIVQVYSNDILGDEELSFKFFDKESDNIIIFRETVLFENNMIIGDGFNTLKLSDDLSDELMPLDYQLNDAYPNPFNPSTSLSFNIPNNENINVSIYDMSGRLITTLINKQLEQGEHSEIWNGMDHNGNSVSSGVYFYTLHGENISLTKKVVMMK